MKQLFTLCLVSLLCISSHTVFGQSKEETISWLKEKLEQSLFSTIGSVKNITIGGISECELTIKVTSSANGWNHYYKLTIPTKEVTLDKEGLFDFNKEAILYEKLEDHAGGAVLEKSYTSSSSYIAVANKETDLHNRIVKAFKHLATFCPQKKEAF